MLAGVYQKPVSFGTPVSASVVGTDAHFKPMKPVVFNQQGVVRCKFNDRHLRL